MSAWVRPIQRGWVVREEVPGPDVDEFAEPDRVISALAGPSARRGLLAVQHPHRTPEALAANLSLADALPIARRTLAELLRTAYRPIADVIAPYTVDGPDGHVIGLLCLVDPAAVDPDGRTRIQHSEEVYPDVIADRAAAVAGLGCATSSAMLIPERGGDTLTETIRTAIDAAGPAAVSTVDLSGRRHRLWLIGPGRLRDALLTAAAASPLLVADGNHRLAATAAAGVDGLLAFVTAGPDVRIGAFHRVLVGTGLDADALAAAWHRAGLTVHDAPPGSTPRPGEVIVRCPTRTLRVPLPPPDPTDPRPRIDHAVVENLLLEKALSLDPAGKHVHPLPANRPAPDTADAVLTLAPVPLADVFAVHAAGRRMPRKSTFFTPKPRSGLLLAELS